MSQPNSDLEISGTYIVLDVRAVNPRAESLKMILTMLVVIVMLGVSSIFFAKDTNELVIVPLTKMTDMIRKLGENPLARIDETEGNSGMETGLIEGTDDYCSTILVR